MRLKTPKVFDERTFSKLIDEVSDNNSSTLNAISLASKFNAASIENNPDCCIIEVNLLSGYDTYNYEHTLKSTPKYWIILRKTGGGTLVEYPASAGGLWNDKVAGFANQSPSYDLTATILLFK
jgi:hypothetical protein